MTTSEWVFCIFLAFFLGGALASTAFCIAHNIPI